MGDGTDGDAGPGRPFRDAVRLRLRWYGGRRLTDPRPCPDCGGRDYRKHDFKERTFAILLAADGPETVTVRYRRFWCRSCERTVAADRSPLFYQGCRYGRPVVDLCLLLAADRSHAAVERALGDVGLRVGRETVARYVDRFDGRPDGDDATAAGVESPSGDGTASLADAVLAALFDGATFGWRPSTDGGRAGSGWSDSDSGPNVDTDRDPDIDTDRDRDIDADRNLDSDSGPAPGTDPDPDAVTDRDPDTAPRIPAHGRPRLSELPDEVALVMRRADLLAVLRAGPMSTPEAVAAVAASRSTVVRALDELAAAGLVEPTPDGHLTTGAGRLAVARYRRLLADGRTPAEVALAARRSDVLDRLRDAPARKRALVAALDRSRSTVDRAVGRLEGAGFVERTPEGYATTPAGRGALDGYRSFLADLRTVLAARDALAAVPADADLPLAPFVDARVETTDARHRLFEELGDALATADRCWALLPDVVDSRQLRLLHDRVLGGDLRATVLADAPVLARLREEFPYLAAELADADDFAARECETPPFAVLLAATEEPAGGMADDLAESKETGPPESREPGPPESKGAGPGTVLLVTFDDGVAGFVASGAQEAVEWALGTVAARAAAGRPATDDLRTAPAAADLPRLTGGRLPPRLRSQGFVRVDAAFFDRREPTAPATAWRAGLGLPEVRAGYAVERRRDGEPFAAGLHARLRDGEHVVVLGPPGSGKSTVCKRVACRWADSAGPVLYREGGRGRPFEATGALATLVERCPEPTLVVVEDAVRADAVAAFEALAAVGDREDVAFLFDAREDEWNDPEGPVDARRAAVRRDRVETAYVPALDADEVERLLARVRDLTGADPGLPAVDLLADVRDATIARDRDEAGATPGGLFVLLHRLARRVAPPADGEAAVPTTLDEHVDGVCRRLAEMGDAALDAGVLVNALNAAGLPVHPAFVHAVAGDDADAHAAVRDALDRLEGEILFEATSGPAYRPIHETWSVEFLAHLLAVEGEVDAGRRFGRCVSALLSLADDPALRERVRREAVATGAPGRVPVDGTAPADGTAVERDLADGDAPDRVAADPATWAGEVVEATFALGRRRPKLAALFDDDGESTVSLPAARPPDLWTARQVWLGRMLLAAGRYGRAERAFERLPEDDVETATERLLGLAEAAEERGEYGTAATHARACLDRADDAGRPTLRARAQLALGRVAHERSEYDAAREHLSAAVDRFEREGARRRRAAALDTLGRVAREQADYDDAREYHRRSRETFADLGDRHGEARALLNFGIVAKRQGDYETARERQRRSREFFEAVGDHHRMARSLINLGTIALSRYDHDAARKHLRRALEITREVGDRHGEARVLLNLGELARREDDREAAEERFRRCLTVSRELGDSRDEATCLNNLGLVALERDEHDAAAAQFRRGLDVCADLGDRHGVARARHNLGLVALERGAYDEAREQFRRSLDACEALADPHGEARNRHALGRVALASDDPAAARERLASAVEGFREVGAVPDALDAVEDLLDACEALDDGEAAAEWVATGSDLAAENDLPDRAAALERRLPADAERAAADGEPGDR